MVFKYFFWLNVIIYVLESDWIRIQLTEIRNEIFRLSFALIWPNFPWGFKVCPLISIFNILWTFDFITIAYTKIILQNLRQSMKNGFSFCLQLSNQFSLKFHYFRTISSSLRKIHENAFVSLIEMNNILSILYIQCKL